MNAYLATRVLLRRDPGVLQPGPLPATSIRLDAARHFFSERFAHAILGPVGGPMPQCPQCQEEVDELHPVKIHGKRRRLCEDCLEIAEEEAEIAEMSEAAVKDMMGYKGSW